MTKIALSLSQLLMFNTKRASRETTSSSARHSKCRETPFPIYTALMIHARTRQRALIDTLFNHGLCISYERTQEISSALANGVIKQFEEDKCVCPTTLRKNLFSVGAVDNIDHNTSSRTSKESFHGTAISVIQFPTLNNPGNDRRTILIKPNSDRSTFISPLSSDFAKVSPVEMPSSKPTVSRGNGEVKAKCTEVAYISRERENEWLEEMHKLDKLKKGEYVSWAAFHASRGTMVMRQTSPIALLPLFTEQAHSPAMIAHAMTSVAKAIKHLNPNQVPVITMDQPLFSIAKRIQWAWPEIFGEDKIVVMLGGLHIEMNIMKLLGDLLVGSGWSSVLVQSGVTTSGRADAVLKGSHVTRSRYVHQVTAAALHVLQKSAYEAYLASLMPYEVPLSLNMWIASRASRFPQCEYWLLVQDLELLALQYVRSIREGNFELYVQCLGQLVPWMFSFDHTNYARWLPIHIKDMVQLQQQSPSTYDQFKQGHFVVQKSDHVFSLMSLGQAHEQMNERIKGDGGIIGLTDNPSALQKWTTAGPEIARIIDEYESSFRSVNQDKLHQHHDKGTATQLRFATDVKTMVSTFEELGNPCAEDSQDLITLDTKEVLSADVVLTLKRIKSIGVAQYEDYVDQRLAIRGSNPVTDIIPKNKMYLFQKDPVKKNSRNVYQLTCLKSNVELFSRMFIACQARDGNLEEFFKHENQAIPPALSDMGGLRACTKSDLIGCLHNKNSALSTETPSPSAKILDGSVVVNMLTPKGCTTFRDYAERVFLPYVKKYLEAVDRLDIVWDRYIQESLKGFTRQKRGSGIRLIVQNGTPIPTNWQSFLRVEDNKTELYQFLAKYIATNDFRGKIVYSTLDNEVIPKEDCVENQLFPCNHEEADTRILLHALNCAQSGHKSVLIRTVDTDVVVLAVSMFQLLPLDELWIAFWTNKSFRFIPVHIIANYLGEQKSKALRFFHAFTGCDNCSSFSSVGKRTAWDTWSVYPDVTEAFVNLSKPTTCIPDDDFQLIQRYVIPMYDRTSGCQSVNEQRRKLFAKGRQLDRIPPTEAALREHVKRAAFQGGHVWGQCLLPLQELPSPGHWGWTKVDGEWYPFWTSLPEAAKTCQELIKCSCKRSCKPPCKCAKASLPCLNFVSVGEPVECCSL